MRIILLCGGSGKRLWPLSNEVRSKLFLKLLPTENGGRESMLQRVCRQLDEAGLLSSTTIVTSQSQIGIVRHHIGEAIPIIAEPRKRGTFMAVCSAVSDLYSQQAVSVDETICVLPVDSFVEFQLFDLLKQLPHRLADSGAELALIGVEPSYPSAQYGYIIPKPQEHKGKDYLDVARFVEKPNEERAAELIGDNALWNCGIFAFSLQFMLTYMLDRGMPVAFQALLEQYEQEPYSEQSFDEEVVEKSNRCIVVRYKHAWRDLGDWRVLTHDLEEAVIGEGYVSSDSLYTHVINENKIPIYVIGLSNIIVAASPDGVLVADKHKSNQIKSMHQETWMPMYEERSWGTLRVLDDSGASIGASTRKVDMMPGGNTSYHRHLNRKEVWIILAGVGQFILNGVRRDIQTGDVLQIASGVDHAVRAITAMQMIEIRLGIELVEDESIQAASSWEDTLRLCSLILDE